MYKKWIGWVSFCIILISILGTIPLPTSDEITFGKRLLQNISILTSFFSILVMFVVIIFLFDGLINKRYSFKVEKLSFGGLNILFDNSDVLFKKSVQNFLDTKRTLFVVDSCHDAFDEVFNSYYETYQFLRVEMRVLNIKRATDFEYYSLSNVALKKLNIFLTKHQNNYRRWHKYISEHDAIIVGKNDDGTIRKLRYHLTPIGEIQSHYYNFEELTNDFQKVNNFFKESFSGKFDIDMKKWSE